MRDESRILITCCSFLLSLAVGIVCYRGPRPLGVDASADVPSAGRMRQSLVMLLGEDEATHSTGTEAGEAFLLRLASSIESFGVQTRRVDLPWDQEDLQYFQDNRPDWIPPELVLKNLLATVPGQKPELAPILIATHHDSCRFGPGAGDAGSGLVALVETVRILSKSPPLRTTHFLFTDGEEYGLLGAHGIAELDPKPFERPVFVLNFDARGTSGGVPMFETHLGNQAAVRGLINHLARPRITSSLAVTVYRTLPNATDFDVWSGQLGYPGFNFATIGGAHHYHQPTDTPENLSDRTLQHIGDHVFAMHQALDVEDVQISSAKDANAVFFDLCGLVVVWFAAQLQLVMAIVSVGLIGWIHLRRRERILSQALKLSGIALAVMLFGAVVGLVTLGVLRTSTWSGARYTPVDLWAGVLTLSVAFIVATFVMEWLVNRIQLSDSVLADWFWLTTSVLGVVLAVMLPGGAYLLVLPCFVFSVIRLATGQALGAAGNWRHGADGLLCSYWWGRC